MIWRSKEKADMWENDQFFKILSQKNEIKGKKLMKKKLFGITILLKLIQFYPIYGYIFCWSASCQSGWNES